MNYIADLHIHSLYSRATSKASHLLGLAAWAAVKGITLVGSGDFTHPGWFAHLHDTLEPAEPGLYRLKPDAGHDFSSLLPPSIRPAASPDSIRFILTAEISSIYKRGGRVRKVHNLLFAPDLEAVRRINTTLARLGNIASDGRPILGLDSRDLLEILLDKAPGGFLIPAHIWTPWFSLFGSKSGFDRIEDCFADLTPHIFALETGLSSDPEMNRLISALDRYTLISNSDCHSPGKLGREANCLATDLDFFALREALRNPVDHSGRQVFPATIEFYPEEGKYHCDGHRKCRICLEPAETRSRGGLCPVCGRPLTVGVLHRVMELADREQPVFPPGSPGVHSLIPLEELIAELLDCGPASRRVGETYAGLINTFGSEFALLMDTPTEEISARGGPLLAEAIARVRSRRVIRRPGYDGEFGVIRVFSEGEREALCGQGNLFGVAVGGPGRGRRTRKPLARAVQGEIQPPAAEEKGLNAEQSGAAESGAAHILVQAGPGTGKTHTLVSRAVRLARRTTGPLTVITFTNKAAGELRQRLQAAQVADERLCVATFHGYCLAQLHRSRPDLRVAGPEQRLALLLSLFPDKSERQRNELGREVAGFFLQTEPSAPSPEIRSYCSALAAQGLIDLDQVVPETVALLRAGGVVAERIRAETGHLLVDEFQDVNAAQYALVALLAKDATLFAIGDPDQAIYGFRGADPRWFAAFAENFTPEIHHLIRNYRSSGVIIDAAAALISHNPSARPRVSMQAGNPAKGSIHLAVCADPGQEAQIIADQVELHLGGISHRSLERMTQAGSGAASFADIGILARTSRQLAPIAEVLTARSIPFQLVDLEAFYTRGDCRSLYFWLLVLAGIAEADHLLHLLSRINGIGSNLLTRLQAAFAGAQTGRDLVACLVRAEIEGPAAEVLGRFLAAVARLRKLAEAATVDQVLQALIAQEGLDPRAGELIRLRELCLTYSSLAECAAGLLAASDSVLYDPRAEAVSLSTLHAAKGLEFPVVCIAGLEEDLLPLAARQPLVPADARLHLEEERRLFYVGITRAINFLLLSWCRQRPGFSGSSEERKPSRFLAELPAHALTPAPSLSRGGRRKSTHRQLSLFS